MRGLGFLGLLVAVVHLTCFRGDPLGTLSGIDALRKRGHTDHVAHVGETRVFPRLGFTMWEIPALTLFRSLTPAELARTPADVQAYARAFPNDTRFVPGYAPDRPLVMNYPHVPRCYPPGVYLLAAPSAFLYHHGLISFGASNRLFLLVVVLTWLVAVLAWTAWWRESAPSLARQLLTAIVVGYTWYWAMEGFYDVSAVALAAAAFEAVRRQRHGLACLFSGLCVLMHSRLFMLAPLFALEFIVAARAWRTLWPRERALALAGVALFVAALAFAFFIQHVVSLHALKQPPSPVRPGAGPWLVVVGYFAVLLTLATLLFREGSRRDALAVVFGGLAFGSQRYLAPWYWLPLLPWALSPASSAGAPPRAMSKTAALARVLVVGMLFLASNAPRW